MYMAKPKKSEFEEVDVRSDDIPSLRTYDFPPQDGYPAFSVEADSKSTAEAAYEQFKDTFVK